MISLGEPGPPLQGARVRSEGAVARSTTTRATSRERSVPRSRRRCSWARTGSSAAERERSTGGRTAVRAPASPPPGQDDCSGRSTRPRESRQAGLSSPAAEARRAGSARGAGADQPPQRSVEVSTQRRAARARRGRQRAHDHERPSGQTRQPPPHEMPQPALYPVPDHGATDRATDHEAYSRTHHRRRDGITGTAAGRVHDDQVHDDAAARRPAAPPHRRREVLAAGQSAGSGQQREIPTERQLLRPTARCDPCGAGPRGWPARRGCACATGTRGSSRGDGCSAETCACPWSRLSFSRCSVLIAGSQPSGLRWWGLRVVGTAVVESSPAGTDGTAASGSHPVRGPHRSVGKGTQNARWWAGDGIEPRPPVPVPSKPASCVTARATRRYIGGACLHGVLVAAPWVCRLGAPEYGLRAARRDGPSEPRGGRRASSSTAVDNLVDA